MILTDNINSSLNSSQTSKPEEPVDKINSSNKKQQQITVQDNNQTTLSSRAGRLSALNQEFDITNPNFTITDNFITRLAELDFISKNKSAELQQDIGVNNMSESTLASIKQSTNEIIDRFKNNEKAQSLVTSLEKTANIIDNFGSTSNSDIFTTIAQLEYHLKNNDIVILTDKETATLNEIKAVLSIAEKLSPQSRTATNVDNYMQQLKQFL